MTTRETGGFDSLAKPGTKGDGTSPIVYFLTACPARGWQEQSGGTSLNPEHTFLKGGKHWFPRSRMNWTWRIECPLLGLYGGHSQDRIPHRDGPN